jgi:molybdopterin synthase catalytic subunit
MGLALFDLLEAAAVQKACPKYLTKLGGPQDRFYPIMHSDFCELTTDPIDITGVARRVVPPDCGATVILDGYVRQVTKGRETQHLVYEAYEPMALKEMQKLIGRAKEQFEIAHVGIVHRLGKLEIGETSVVISVAAPHRKAAFAACEWLIRELKSTVPIWKKEVYADGEVWVEGKG